MRFTEEQYEKILLAYWMVDSKYIESSAKIGVDEKSFLFVNEFWKSLLSAGVDESKVISICQLLGGQILGYYKKTRCLYSLMNFESFIGKYTVKLNKTSYFNKNQSSAITNFISKTFLEITVILEEEGLTEDDFPWILEDYRRFLFNRESNYYANLLMSVDAVNDSEKFVDTLQQYSAALRKHIPWSEGNEDKFFSTVDPVNFLVSTYQEQLTEKPPVPSGFHCIDEAFGGWSAGTLHLVVGGSGAGKSLFLMNSAIAARRAGKNVLYVSFELNERDLAYRHLQIECGFNTMDLRKGKTSVEELKNIAKLIDTNLGEIKYYFCNENRTPEKVEELILKFQDEKQLDLLVLDYIGEMDHNEKYNLKNYEIIEKVFGDIMRLAQKYKLPVLTAQQLNREGIRASDDSYDFKLSDISGGQQIGHRCTNIFIMNPTKEKDRINIFHKKARNAYIDGFKFQVRLEGIKFIEESPLAWYKENNSEIEKDNKDPAEEDEFEPMDWLKMDEEIEPIGNF